MNAILLIVVVFAWGLSWYGILLQVGEASALISVTYRFYMAAAVMCAGLWLTGRLKPIPPSDHKLLAALGFCLFSMNFLCFYIAANYLPSGILSVVFATAAIFGAINGWLFLGQKLEAKVFLAAGLGLVGLALLLSPEFDGSSGQDVPIWAIALPFFGTMLFSFGNIASAKLSTRHALPNIVGQGMVWGAIHLTVLCLVTGESFVVPATLSYWGGMVFLALVSSLLAFLTYLTLVNRIGTARAAYATVLFPIVAMLISTFAEGYEWGLVPALGLVMALGGTVLIFGKRSVR